MVADDLRCRACMARSLAVLCHLALSVASVAIPQPLLAVRLLHLQQPCDLRCFHGWLDSMHRERWMKLVLAPVWQSRSKCHTLASMLAKAAERMRAK
eukprot:3448665-Amphidinium_carterae.1